ncbi:MAG: hypothetical protein ABR556_11695 [Pyrinomonadaceae bacterium]
MPRIAVSLSQVEEALAVKEQKEKKEKQKPVYKINQKPLREARVALDIHIAVRRLVAAFESAD